MFKSNIGKFFFGWLGLSVLTLTLILINRPIAIAEGAKNYTELQFPPLGEVQVPKYDRYQLENGMVVYLMEDHQLPLVSGSAIIHAGSRWEPPDRIGLAEITGELLRSGGTKQHSVDELNNLLEQRAATIETNISTVAGGANFNSLTEDLDTVFSLFAEVLRSPNFEEKQFELEKKKMLGGIERRNDNPEDIASREFRKLIYGKDNPYSRVEEYKTVNNIAREDTIGFYEKYYHPENIILGIVGDFDSGRMKQLVAEKFGNWQKSPTTISEIIPTASQQIKEGIFLVDQPQLTQSSIILGHIDGDFKNPDYPALDVLNGVINGYGGRLFNQIRSREGLAYSVYGYWTPAYDYPGLFIAGGQTRTDATVPFIQSLTNQLEKLQTAPVTTAELAYAKESILNSFVFNFQKPAQTLARLMRYEYFGYPPDFIFQYQKAVKSTSKEDVLRVVQKYLKLGEMVTLVVGNQKDLNPPLTTLNSEVKTIDVSIPKN
jgi:zinc protease